VINKSSSALPYSASWLALAASDIFFDSVNCSEFNVTRSKRHSSTPSKKSKTHEIIPLKGKGGFYFEIKTNKRVVEKRIIMT